jgi:hypothetical protein
VAGLPAGALRKGAATSILSEFKPWATTGIGALPFDDPAEAVAHVWSSYDLQFVPQLPRLDRDVLAEWTRPRAGRCDWSAERDRIRPTSWPETLRAIQAVPPTNRTVKLQVAGPCSLAHSLATCGVGDTAGLARSLGLWLAANAATCVSQLERLGVRTLVTVDEPELIESGLSPMEAMRAWQPLSRAASAWAIHTCGPPPWPVLAQADADALFLDVRGYPLSREGARVVARLIEHGGRIGLGVASADDHGGPTGARDALDAALAALAEAGVTRAEVGRAAFLTPTCGTGQISPAKERVVSATLDELARC